MSQDRLNRILAAAAEAARSSPDWRDGDELVIVLADDTDTVMHAWGFGVGQLLACLEYHAGKLRQVG